MSVRGWTFVYNFSQKYTFPTPNECVWVDVLPHWQTVLLDTKPNKMTVAGLS